MTGFTLRELQCLDAVVREGGFQAAAAKLHRSHPAIFAAVSKLERRLDLQLLDRSGYRVRATEAGLSLLGKAHPLLQAADELQVHAEQMAMGEETQMRVVVGDLFPRPQVLGLLGSFFADCKATRLHLHFEAVGGPRERLLDDEADLILHRIDKRDTRLEWVDLGTTTLLPVAVPGFLPPSCAEATHARMREFTQCILRDTARHTPDRDYYVVEGAHQCTVADHQMKKEIVLQGIAWGHLPVFMIDRELREGTLVSLAGRYFPGITEELVAARRRDRPHGPVAERLWRRFQARGRQLASVLGTPPGKPSPRSR